MSQRDFLHTLVTPGASNPCQDSGGNRHWHTGRVVALGHATVDVALEGSSTPKEGVKRSALYAPVLGDYVLVDHEGDQWFVAHPVAH